MYDGVYIEGKGKPVAIFVFQYFVNDAQSAASSKGMPHLRVVPEAVVSECTDRGEIESGVNSVMDRVIEVLTAPLTAEEKSPQPRVAERPERIVFKGTLEEVNLFFYRRGWTDGLPVVPPTEEAVAEMLKGTDLPPDHLVATLVPRKGKATVEKIAVNAVMAGCLPTYMPLLIAGVQAMASNRVADMMAVSTGSWAPFWIINGPVRRDIHINYGFGAMNPGDMANITIGRALGLITKNLRGIRKGIEDMGVLGNPMKFSMVAGENEEDTPWEPLHVERGFKKEDSTVSLSFPQSYDQLYPYGTDDEGLLKTVIYNLTPVRMGITGIILTPTNVRSLAKKGWTKQAVKDYILENARVPFSHHMGYSAPVFESGEKLPEHKPDELVPIIRKNARNPDPVQIYIFGGMGSWVGIVSGGGDINTVKLEFPQNWEALVKKYRNVVPNYVRY